MFAHDALRPRIKQARADDEEEVRLPRVPYPSSFPEVFLHDISHLFAVLLVLVIEYSARAQPTDGS